MGFVAARRTRGRSGWIDPSSGRIRLRVARRSAREAAVTAAEYACGCGGTQRTNRVVGWRCAGEPGFARGRTDGVARPQPGADPRQ
eukprot:1194015-Pyramimonas_sp.AAC.2